MKTIKNTTNNIWAIPAAVPAIPVKPSTPAMIAIIKNMKAHESILIHPLIKNLLYGKFTPFI
jgi:hypothetical protein